MEIEIHEEVYCRNCKTQLTHRGLPLRNCQHLKWYIYGNKCFECALYNTTSNCDIITNIEICKKPIKKRVYVIQDGSTYYVLAPALAPFT